MIDSSAEYTSLLHEDGQLKDEIYPGTPRESKSSDSFTTHFVTRWAIMIIAICTVFDLVLVSCVGVQYVRSTFWSQPHEPLEMRSSYVNLDVLYSNPTVNKTSRHGPITSHARAFAQVSSAQPDRVYPSYVGREIRKEGVLPLYERHLMVTPEIATIASFRVLDFGMESCSLAIAVAQKNQTTDFISGPRGDDTVTLDIWSLEVQGVPDLHNLSWKTRPQSRSFLGPLTVSYGAIHQTPQFPCNSQSYVTVEVSCPTPECQVDVLGMGTETASLYMYQYQTV
ncbi:hypothetical protein BJ138DRAFT_1112041 [Hygrophoropsis aurantiaca]|uniref:Uncharacterized protein n=1 Tax=Hygrophoropsis aurantiaca TaxID=72124 RepID=A0ACB8AH92_9AGAM|nr:hypothetical protein BJ138DRAFT_1112041 [Hygrophoropsis aurantiaca]